MLKFLWKTTATLLFVIITVMLLVFASPWIEAMGDRFSALSTWLLILMVVTSFPLATFIHELGHYFAARALGFSIATFAAGPVIVDNSLERISMHFNATSLLGGGQVVALRDTTEGTASRFAAIVASGPLTSLAGGGLLPLALIVLPAGATALFIAVIGITSLITFVVALIPYKHKGVESDGLQLLKMAFNPIERQRKIAIIVLMGNIMSGQRTRDLDTSQIRILKDQQDNKYLHMLGVYYAFLKVFDEENHTEAMPLAEELDQMLSTEDSDIPVQFRDSVAWALTIYFARRDMPERSREFREMTNIQSLQLPEAYLTIHETELARAEGRLEDAHSLLKRCQQELVTANLIKGQRPHILASLDDLRARISGAA